MDSHKRSLVWFWLVKGRREFDTARQIAALPGCHLDVAILHCHRAAEKTIKAFLIHHDHSLPDAHDLHALVTLAMRYEPGFAEWQAAALALSEYAATHDTPGRATIEATREELHRALDAAGQFVLFIPMLLPHDLNPG